MRLFTCTPSADADLAGLPAAIRRETLRGTFILDFLDGSALEVTLSQLVEL